MQWRKIKQKRLREHREERGILKRGGRGSLAENRANTQGELSGL